MSIIELNLKKIISLCHQYKVKTLAVFGSVLTDKFNDDSDIDLLVDFEPIDHEKIDYVDNYFNLRDGLEAILNRKVDLLEQKGLRNRYLIDNINRNKIVIYG